MLIIAACLNGETAGRAALSTMGLDLPADFRDLAACFTVNFNPGDPVWWANLADCAASFLPLVGESRFFGAGAGLFKHAYQRLQVEKEIPYKATLGSEYYLNNESIPDPEDYWNRQDGYFSGNWWLDEEKKQEALNVLVKESLLAEDEAGGYDLMTHYIETEPGSAKRYALQLMFQLEPTDGDDETVLTI